MGYLGNIIADARPRQVVTMSDRAVPMHSMAGAEQSPFAMDEAMGARPLPQPAMPSEKRSPDNSSNKTMAAGDANTGRVHGLDENTVFGGEEGAGTSDHRRAVPPFGDHSETEKYVYSQSSRTASNEEEETETSASRPGGSRIHVTEIGDEAISSVVSQFSKSTSNFLESVMTRQDISGATEKSETRTSSSNGRGENGVFLQKQGENVPSGGLSASPPLLFSSERDAVPAVSITESHRRQVVGPAEQEDNSGFLSQHVIEGGLQQPEPSVLGNPSHKDISISKPESDTRGGLQQSEPGISGKHIHKENDQLEQDVLPDPRRQHPTVSPDIQELRPVERRDDAEPETLPSEMKTGEKQLEQAVHGKSLPQDNEIKEQKLSWAWEAKQPIIKKEMAVSFVEPPKSRPEGPKISIGSIEIIVEAPTATTNQSQAQTSSPSLSSRRYLRRL